MNNENKYFKGISIDYERYAHYLENEALSEAQKRAFLETLWNIIVAFVDLGFGVHPLKRAGDEPACGQKAKFGDLLMRPCGKPVSSREQVSGRKLIEAARGFENSGAERQGL